MKRILLALAVGVALFAIVAFAANALIVYSGALQSGADADLTCDTAVNVSYQDGDNNGVFEWARVGDIDGPCGPNVDVTVTVTDTDGGLGQVAFGSTACVALPGTGVIWVGFSDGLASPSEVLGADHVAVDIVGCSP